MTPFREQLRRKIHDKGPIPFSDYMEELVRFYYSSLRSPIGMEGDFYTSPDLDPILGQLLAKQFFNWAASFDHFTLVELGAGKGLLARHILEQQRFPYMILERSSAMRERQRELLRDFDVTWIDDLPSSITGCIFSNEFFDALPVHRVVSRGGVLREIYVTGDFTEVDGEVQPDVAAYFEGVGPPPLMDGHVTEVRLGAIQWIKRIAATLHHGYHLAIDYGYLREDFQTRPQGTLMCYRHHQATENPYVNVGEQDITAHVNFSDLMEEPSLETLSFTTQQQFLIQLGILDQMERLATSGDAASMQRLLKMKTLILPGSMGERFKVLVQRKPGATL